MLACACNLISPQRRSSAHHGCSTLHTDASCSALTANIVSWSSLRPTLMRPSIMAIVAGMAFCGWIQTRKHFMLSMLLAVHACIHKCTLTCSLTTRSTCRAVSRLCGNGIPCVMMVDSRATTAPYRRRASRTSGSTSTNWPSCAVLNGRLSDRTAAFAVPACMARMPTNEVLRRNILCGCSVLEIMRSCEVNCIH